MIHSVEKRKKRVNGVLTAARMYSLRYRIGDMPCDKWVSLGVTDKGVARVKADLFIKDLERELAGLAPPKKQVEAANLSWAKLVVEYVDEMRTRGKDAKYIKGTETRLVSVAAACRWKKLGDVSAESFMLWRRGQNLKAKTLNDYLSDVTSFLGWLVKLGRLASNPLARVGRVLPKGDEEEKRRAFTVEEFERLCSVSGPRALLYQVTLFTGLRRGEVGQLVWGDVQQNRDGGTVLRLRASTTKDGKEALQPLPPWLADLLTKQRPASARLSDKVFACLPRMPRFKRDLEAAGIRYRDDRGHVAVFHSLRHYAEFPEMPSGAGAVPEACRLSTDPEVATRHFWRMFPASLDSGFAWSRSVSSAQPPSGWSDPGVGQLAPTSEGLPPGSRRKATVT